MTAEEIEKLRGFCKDFSNFRQNTVDGDGKNLHDIKHSFDYVRQTIDNYRLTGTKFGTELSTKAENAGKILSQLWLCLQDLESSIELFCEQQEYNNNNRTN